MATTFDYTKAKALDEAYFEYNSFSGADMVIYMGHKRVSALQGITISITREVVPVYVSGNPNPVTFVKGKRAIAGNLVFTQFDKHALLKAAEAFNTARLVGDLWKATDFSDILTYSNGLTSDLPNKVSTEGAAWLDAVNREVAATYDLVRRRKLRYSDQIPPFDVTITFANESGASAWAAVFGVTLSNEGYGWTLDDITPEMAVSYQAVAVSPLQALTGDRSVLTSG